MGEEHVHAKAFYGLAEARHPLVWLGRDPIGADEIAEPIPANSEFGRNHPIGALRSGHARGMFEEATICINLSWDGGEMKQ